MPPVLSGSAFEDIRAVLRNLPAADRDAAEQTRLRDAQLTKPAGSLGRLEEIAEWLSAWQGRHPPTVLQPQVAIFAANHGVAQRGVSAFPPSVTQQMVENFAAGGAAINQLCQATGAGLKIFDLALDMPTPDICEAAAMSEKDCVATIAFGMEAVAGGGDLLCIGEMGIGNTTVASAICHALFGGNAEEWVGQGTGADAQILSRKKEAVRCAVAFHGLQGGGADPLDILRRVGGREIAAMAGAILAARVQRIPVLLDGFVAGAAAAVLHCLQPGALDHCLAAHVSAESAHGRLLQLVGKRPLLDLGMRLGEGSGAALAISIVRAAAEVHGGMATFAQAGVSGRV